MSTTKIEVTSSWQQVATAEQFLLENQSSYDVRVRFDTAPPAADDPSHVLRGSEAITRMGLVGNVYVKGIPELGFGFVIATLGE